MYMYMYYYEHFKSFCSLLPHVARFWISYKHSTTNSRP